MTTGGILLSQLERKGPSVTVLNLSQPLPNGQQLLTTHPKATAESAEAMRGLKPALGKIQPLWNSAMW